MAKDAPRKVPALRFKGFTEDWIERRLGDIVYSYSGGTPSVNKKSYYGGDIPFIRSAEINSKSTELFLSPEGLINSSAKKVMKGDILYALYGATSGEVSLSKIDGAINQAILAIIPQKNYSSAYIVQWLKSSKKSIIQTYLQGGQGNLSGTIVNNLRIQLPSYTEQQQLGKIFKEVDQLISLHQKRLSILKQLRMAYMINMIPDQGGTIPDIRTIGFQSPWVKTLLGEVASIQTGSRNHQESVADGKHPFFVRSADVEKINSYDYDTEAILVPGDGKIGEIFHYINGKFALHQRVYKVDQFKGVIPSFLLYSFKRNFRRHAMRLNAQGTVPSLRLPMFTDWSLSLPGLEEQQKIGNLLKKVDAMITVEQQRINHFRMLKKSLLNKMFIS